MAETWYLHVSLHLAVLHEPSYICVIVPALFLGIKTFCFALRTFKPQTAGESYGQTKGEPSKTL